MVQVLRGLLFILGASFLIGSVLLIAIQASERDSSPDPPAAAANFTHAHTADFWKDRLAHELRYDDLEMPDGRGPKQHPKASRTPQAAAWEEAAGVQRRLRDLTAVHEAREAAWRALVAQWEKRHTELLLRCDRAPAKLLQATLPAEPLPVLPGAPSLSSAAATQGGAPRTMPMLTPATPLALTPLTNTTHPEYVVFILYVQNLPMMYHVLNSVLQIFPAGRVVVVDNSWTGAAAASKRVAASGAHVLRTLTWLTFPQMHNLLAWQATSLNLKAYFWIHSDAVVLPNTPGGPDVGGRLLEGLGRYMVEKPDWGVAFYAYDILAAFNPAAVLDVPWDELILSNYYADCDQYNRLRRAGYKCDGFGGGDLVRVYHLGEAPAANVSIYSLPLEDQHRVYAAHDKNVKAGAGWREMNQTPMERTAGVYIGNVAHQYFKAKWNSLDCGLHGSEAAFDVPSNRVQPPRTHASV